MEFVTFISFNVFEQTSPPWAIVVGLALILFFIGKSEFRWRRLIKVLRHLEDKLDEIYK